MMVQGGPGWGDLAPLFGPFGSQLRPKAWIIADATGHVQATSLAELTLGKPIFDQIHIGDRAWLHHEWPRYCSQSGTLTIRWSDGSVTDECQALPFQDGVAIVSLAPEVGAATRDWPVGIISGAGGDFHANFAATRLLDTTANPPPNEVQQLVQSATETPNTPIYYPRTGAWLLIQQWKSGDEQTLLIQDVTQVAKAQIKNERFAHQAETLFRREEVLFYVLDPISGEAQLTGCWPGGEKPPGNVAYDDFLSVIHPQDRPRVERWHVEILPAAEGVIHQYRIGSDADGWRKVSDHMHLIGRPNGSGWIIVGTIESSLENASSVSPTERDFTHTARLITLGELSASLAHEVNNPLAALAGHAELLASHSDPEIAEAGKQILSLAERAGRIVARTRRLASPGCAEPELIDVNNIVTGAVEMVEHSYRKAGVLVDIHSVEACHGYFRATDLEQTLVNLLSNARDAVQGMHGAHVNVIVQTDAGAVTIQIADNGPGIPEAKREEIFTPFFTTKGVNEGTGLGLSISRSLIESGGGTLVLAPSDIGACFQIRIPCSSSQSKEAPAA
ncbi:MAG: hypothetical protein KF812_10465 [Fimbriimonadaceae bacterium]|nr:hypothetical protein [Fimbriimonadaceae bacterium]